MICCLELLIIHLTYFIQLQQGETMSKDDVRKMIDEVDENKDGKLDYGEVY